MRVQGASLSATLRAGPGLASETLFTLWLSDSSNSSNAVVAGATVRTLDVTPPAYTAGTPRVSAAGASGAAFAAALSEPGAVSFLLLPTDASPPSLEDVLRNARRACAVASACVTQCC